MVQRSTYRNTFSVKLLIILAIASGTQADCSGLAVYQNNKNISTDSICIRKYKTAACKEFVQSFNQSHLPEEFPRSDESVEAPEVLETNSYNTFIENKASAWMSVRWKPPLSSFSRKNCFGYLLIWYTKEDSLMCQLFQLNQTNPLLQEEVNTLLYEFNITVATKLLGKTFTVKMYSMPTYSSALKNNNKTFVSNFIAIPKQDWNIEPADWRPYITYNTSDYGTVTGKFNLPPLSWDLKRFTLMVVNDSERSEILYTKDYYDEVYADNKTEVTFSFTVNNTGSYKIVVKVLEDESTRNNINLCKCWKTLANAQKVCENTCGSTYTVFQWNLTRPPDAAVTIPSPTETTNTPTESLVTQSAVTSTQMNATPSVHYSSQMTDNFLRSSEAFIGGLVGAVLLLMLTFLLCCCYMKNKTVKHFVNRWFCVFNKKPQHVLNVEVADPLPKSKPVLAPLTTKIVYIMYTDDHDPHLQLVECFSLFLEIHCHCKVLKALSSKYSDLSSGFDGWIVNNMNMADCIIFINSEGAEKLILTHLEQNKVGARRSAVEAAFDYGLKQLFQNANLRERKVALASFRGKHCQKYLHAAEVHMLPEHLPQLLRRIHNLNAANAETYHNLLPLQLENVPSLPEGEQLFSAIKNVKDYEDHNQDWLEKKYKTSILSSIDSGYSGFHFTSYDSMQDLTCSKLASPVSVFEQPNFTSYTETNSNQNSSRPQGIASYFVHTPGCTGNCVCEQSLPNTSQPTDSSNLDEKLSCLTVYEPHYNNLSLQYNKQSHTTDTSRTASITPTFKHNGNNEKYFPEYTEILINNCEDHVSLDFDDGEDPSHVKVTPPETISNIQEDSISEAFLSINANTDIFFGGDDITD